MAADSDYTLHFTGNTLTITPASLTVTANAQTKVYGTADPDLTYSAIGFVNATVDGVPIDDTAASVLMGTLARAHAGTQAGEQVGGYTITQGTLGANGNYTTSFNSGTLTITPATLTATANPQTKVYGSADPSLTYSAKRLRQHHSRRRENRRHCGISADRSVGGHARRDGGRWSLRDHAGDISLPTVITRSPSWAAR